MKLKGKKIQHIIFIVCALLFFGITASGSYLLNRMDTQSSSGTTDDDNKGDFLSQMINKVKPIRTPINVFVLCGDQSSGNTDTIMVVHYDPVTCDISMISIPRDTAVIINNAMYKINFAYPSGGMDRAVSYASKLLGVNLDYYCYLDTKVFRNCVDILGGVYIDIPVDMKYDDKSQNLHINFKKGKHQLLNGRKAEEFVRFRKPNHGRYTQEMFKYYDGGDLRRIDAQQTFIKEMIKQKVDIKYLPKVNELIKEIFDNIKTNMKVDTATRLLYNIQNLNISKMKSYTIGGAATYYNSLSYMFYNGTLDNTTKKKVKNENTAKVIEREFSSKGLLAKASQYDAQSMLNSINAMRSAGSGGTNASGGSKTNSYRTPTPYTKPTAKHTSVPNPITTPKPVTTPKPQTPAPIRTPVPPVATPKPEPVETQ